MPKATFILATVLFGVICGNRLMDNRFVRSLSYSPSYLAPYKAVSDVNMNSYNRKVEKDIKLKALRKPPYKTVDLPCGSVLDFDQDLTARHCNDNIVSLVKNPINYLTYDNNNDDDPEVNDVLQTEPVIFQKSSRNMKKLQSQLNAFPIANYKDFYDDLVVENIKEEMPKRNGNAITSVFGSSPPRGCDCKLRNDLVDLGQQHFPRYLLNAICHSEHSRNDLGPKCWSGSVCRPLEYKVKVLTFRTIVDNLQKDPTSSWLPDDLRPIWKFKTVTVAAGCFCS